MMTMTIATALTVSCTNFKAGAMLSPLPHEDNEAQRGGVTC